MFLTKKGFWKIIIVTLCYFAIGSFCIAAGVMLTVLDTDANFLFVLGALCYVLCPLFIFWGRYAEGKGKLINLWNKLVRNELQPHEFIKEYQRLKNLTDLVVNKPSIEILQLVAIAYDSLDDRENCLSAVEEMLSVAPEKKRSLVKLMKCSFLFSFGRTEEAEALFFEVQREKPNAVCRLMIDNIGKSDRAIAMGDYKTAEQRCLEMLSKTFPKLDNLGKLVTHFSLGEVYEKLAENEKAAEHYRYCAENGGETAIKESAITALERILAL